jgi:hypothetical protein
MMLGFFKPMKLPLVVLGIALLVIGSMPIILGSNEILALNDCTSGSRACFVRSGDGFCGQNICTIDPFYGQGSIGGIRSLAYSLIEIGAVVGIVGVAVAVIGARVKSGLPKEQLTR